MTPAIKDTALQLLETFKSLDMRKKTVLIATVVITIASLIGLVLWAKQIDYKPLYTGLPTEDSGAIIKRLQDMRINYKVAHDGTTILVPGDRVYELRMELASEGLPHTGTGYEIFDKQAIGVTEFVQKINYQRALEGELARTISQFSEVRTARVHLTLPERSLFLEDRQPPRASIAITLHPGRMLNEQQFQGITHLVVGSVEGIQPENITIVDSHGRLVHGGTARKGPADIKTAQQRLQREIENDLEGKVVSMLSGVVGHEGVTARVSVNLDFTQVEQTIENFDPDTAAVRSEQRTTERSSGRSPGATGVPGVMSNIPDIQDQEAAAGIRKTDYSKSDETINYEISRVTKRVINQIGAIEKIGCAVMIDGTYITEKDGEGRPVRTYVPRTGEEMRQFESLVKTAIGFNANRGDTVEVVNVQFLETVPEEIPVLQKIAEQVNIQALTRLVVIAFLFIALYMLAIKPLIRMVSQSFEAAEKSKLEAARLELEKQERQELAGAIAGKQQQVGGRQGQLIEFAKQNPKLFAQYIKTVMR